MDIYRHSVWLSVVQSVSRCRHTNFGSFRIFQDASISPYGDQWLQGADPLAGRPVCKSGDFPNAELFSTTTIQMPAFTASSESLIRQYVDAFAKVQKHADELVGLYQND